MFDDRRRLALAAISLFAAPAPLLAIDGSEGVPLGQLHAEPPGAVSATAAARISLEGKELSVILPLAVRGQATVLRLDLPRFEWLGDGETYPDRHFPELRAAVDGRPVTPTDDFRVEEHGRDITGLVRAAGLDPFVVADGPSFVKPVRGRQAPFDALVVAGAVQRLPDYIIAPGEMLADWTAQRIVRIAPGAGAHVVTLRYKARPGFALVTLRSRRGAMPAVAAALRGTGLASREVQSCLASAMADPTLARRGLTRAILVQHFAVPLFVPNGSALVRVSPVSRRVATVVCRVAAPSGVAIDPPNDGVRAMAGTDGAVHVLRIAPPGLLQ